MVARLAISSTGRNGQYVGTSKETPPVASPGSPAARYFNGTRDRLVGRRSNDLGATFVLILNFWRADGSTLANNQTAARLFTQYCIGGTRVGVGLNRQALSISYTTSTGATFTVESAVKVIDTDRHVLMLQVTATEIIVWLDGREAIRVSVVLRSADTAYTVIGADAASRFFKGYIDDVAIYQTPPYYVDNWARYYQALILQTNPRDFVAASFGANANLVTLTDRGYTATGTLAVPISRAALNSPFRTEPELPLQFVEFQILASPNSAQLQLAVFNLDHDFAAAAPGTTVNSYAYTQAGKLVSNSADAVTGIDTWTAANVMALGWVAATRTLSLWKDGIQIHSFQLPAGTWTPAVNIGSNMVRVNTGQAVWLSLPKNTAGLPVIAYSRLNTEYRHLQLGELSAPLNDVDEFVRDARTGISFGSYLGQRQLYPSITVDSLDRSSGVSDGIRILFGAYGQADDAFFFAIAMRPTAADLVGEHVLLESPGSWSFRLIDGRVFASVGEVQVGSVDPAFEADHSYLVGITRSASGKLMVWCHVGYMLQSGDATVTQVSAEVWVGSSADGSKKFEGRLSHLLLSSATIPSWKLERLRNCYTWDVPNVAGLLPNPATVRRVIEPSYRDVLATGISGSPAYGSSYAAALAAAPDPIAVEVRMISRTGANPFAGEYVRAWTTSAILTAELPRLDASATVEGYAAGDLDHVAVGEAVLIDDEICRIDSINRVTGALTLARGCADTLPARHAAGSRVWFYEDTLASTRIAYGSSSAVDVKLLSRSALAELPEELAPTDQLVMNNRLSRPYPPANVTINDEYEPTSLGGTVSVKWRARNRVSQAADLVPWTAAAIAAPTDTLFVVRMYSRETSELLHESTAQASTVNNYDLLVDFAGDVTVTVTSYLAGLACLQVPSLSFDYDSDMQVIITSEEGEALETETEDANIEAETLSARQAASYSGNYPDDYEEEEEEDVVGDVGGASGDHVMGVKMSEFGEYPVAFVGDEQVPLFKAGTNYWANFTAILGYVLENMPDPVDGKSAYELAVQQGYTGSLSQWIASLQGPAGPSSNASRRIQTITSASGAVVCDWASYDEIRLRLTGNVSLTFTGARDGQGCMLKFQQDGTGGRSVTLPGTVRYNDLIQHFTVKQAAAAIDRVGFTYDSSDSAYDLVTSIPGISF